MSLVLLMRVLDRCDSRHETLAAAGEPTEMIGIIAAQVRASIDAVTRAIERGYAVPSDEAVLNVVNAVTNLPRRQSASRLPFHATQGSLARATRSSSGKSRFVKRVNGYDEFRHLLMRDDPPELPPHKPLRPFVTAENVPALVKKAFHDAGQYEAPPNNGPPDGSAPNAEIIALSRELQVLILAAPVSLLGVNPIGQPSPSAVDITSGSAHPYNGASWGAHPDAALRGEFLRFEESALLACKQIAEDPARRAHWSRIRLSLPEVIGGAIAAYLVAAADAPDLQYRPHRRFALAALNLFGRGRALMIAMAANIHSLAPEVIQAVADAASECRPPAGEGGPVPKQGKTNDEQELCTRVVLTGSGHGSSIYSTHEQATLEAASVSAVTPPVLIVATVPFIPSNGLSPACLTGEVAKVHEGAGTQTNMLPGCLFDKDKPRPVCAVCDEDPQAPPDEGELLPPGPVPGPVPPPPGPPAPPAPPGPPAPAPPGPPTPTPTGPLQHLKQRVPTTLVAKLLHELAIDGRFLAALRARLASIVAPSPGGVPVINNDARNQLVFRTAAVRDALARMILARVHAGDSADVILADIPRRADFSALHD